MGLYKSIHYVRNNVCWNDESTYCITNRNEQYYVRLGALCAGKELVMAMIK